MKNQRFGMLFDTSNESHYYYDAGTGKVILCSDEEKNFISKILSNEISLIEACKIDKIFADFIKKEHLFSDKKWSFIVPTRDEFEDMIEGNCEQIVLELTEACNLRCGYCIYNEHHPNHRKFSNKNMNFDIAKKSIDYILKNFKKNEFALTFYGGEPLINFELMKKCIEYVKNKYSHIKMSYGFTTNLTLINDEMIEYFKTIQDIDIVCSIDGPKDFHDRYRKDIVGMGSFKRAIEGLKKLLTDFYSPEHNRNLSINCVLTPPYEKKKLETVSNFLYEELKLPKRISCNYSYVDAGEMKFEEQNKECDDKEENNKKEQKKNEKEQNKIEYDKNVELSPLESWAADDFLLKRDDSKYFDIISIELSRIANRFLSEDGFIDKSFIHGNCIPGQRRIYVTVDGEFKPCEKVGNVPTLGNYIDGYDYEKSYNMYIRKYTKYFRKMCNDCWARTMCGVCYESTLGGDEKNPYVSGELCNTSRKIIKDMFVNYYRLFEIDRDSLAEALSKIELR